MSTFDRAAHTRIEPPAVDIKVIDKARRQESGIAVAGIPHTRQGRDVNLVNVGVCRDLATRVGLLLRVEAPLRGFRGINAFESNPFA